jgi:L,D-transpeptidase catalytic domain
MRRAIVFAAAIVAASAVQAAGAADLGFAERLRAAAPAADPVVLQLAARAVECARREGLEARQQRLAVIDYSRPSTEPRLWVFDVLSGRLLFQELVAHGRGTGEKLAERFSNIEGSHMSSLGLFRTAETYQGSNGYSLRLHGLEQGFNDRALARAIVMHGAPYVGEAIAAQLGRLGRSFGCPAVRPEVARPLIDTLKDGSLLFAYYPDRKWLSQSRFLSCGGARSADGSADAVRGAAVRGLATEASTPSI